MTKIKVGDRIQHCCATGDVFLVVLERPEHGDALAVTDAVDPRLTRVINEDNWRIVSRGGKT